MLDSNFHEKSLNELLFLLRTARRGGSASVQDFKDLVMQKFEEYIPSYTDFDIEWNKFGNISDNISELRKLLNELGLYDTYKDIEIFQDKYK